MDRYISLDIKDAFLMVPQVEVMLLRSLNGWVNVLESQRHTGYFEGACQNSAMQRSDGISTLQRFVRPQGLDLFLVHRQCCDMKT